MLVKKISRATVFGDKADVQELVLKDRKTEHKLYIVGGICNTIDRTTSKFKDAKEDESEERRDFKFIGRFTAVNAQTGEMFKSPICYLPAFAANIVAGEFQEGDRLEFAFEIGAKYVEASATSYEFTVRQLIEHAPDENMQQIEALLTKSAKGTPAIAGPVAIDKSKA